VDTDILVIGGGIAGLSLAAALGDGVRTVVVEAEATLGYHATGRSAALYTECYGSETIRKLARASKPYLTQDDTPLIAPRGLIFVAPSGDDDALNDLARDFGPENARFFRISPEEVERACGVFPTRLTAGGMFEPDAADIDVDSLQTGYVAAARSNGVTILTDFRVTSITRSDSGWVVGTSDQEITASVLVNAAGAWGDGLALLAGVQPLGLTPLARSVFTFDPGMDPQPWPMTVDARERWYLKPEGPHMLGSAASELPSEPTDARPQEIDVALGIDKINRASDLQIRSVRNTWAGLRTFTSDRVPAVGFDPQEPAFFWLVGQGGYGIKTSPAIGSFAASVIHGRAIPDAVAAEGLTGSELAPERLR